MTTLRDLKVGEKGIITKVRGRGAFRKRITEMGFIKGKEVSVIRYAPLKDPIDYKIMGYEVSLRGSEAELIEIVTPNELEVYHIEESFEGVIEADPLAKIASERGKVIDVALVGNPNSGKTTLFNFASHSRQMTGNYGGVTVDSKEAHFKLEGYTFNLTDLPGTYSLSHYTPEELFVREHIREKLPDIVINVIDSSNIERNLYLTTQLIDMDIRVVIALNMHDEMMEKGDLFDHQALGKMLGVPFVPTIGSKKKGIQELFKKVIEVYEDTEPIVRHIHINYGQDLESAIEILQAIIKEDTSTLDAAAPRYFALKLLEKDEAVTDVLRNKGKYDEIRHLADREIKKLETLHREDTETLITDARYGFIGGALKETLKPGEKEKGRKSRFLDKYVTSKYLSYPIFFFFMWIMFEATFLIGSYPMEWISMLVDYLGDETTRMMAPGMIRDMLVNGIIGGVGGVVVFLPNILILFLFISLIEDSGYMARVAFIVDRIMHKVGLHGRSFIPLLMGFGCNVPAIMATRTIESRSDRLVTMMITPLMSCSARYPVYVLLISAFFDSYQGFILFSIYIVGIMLAALMAVILKKTMFRAEEVPFVMELPPYRLPTVKNTLRHTWHKGSQYLKKMGGIILFASLIIWILGYFPRHKNELRHYEVQKLAISKSYDLEISRYRGDSLRISKIMALKAKDIQEVNIKMENERQERSFIGMIGHFIEPVMRPLGFDWKMSVSLIAGAAAKEIVVSTMGVLYETGGESSLIERIQHQTYEDGPKKGKKVFTPLVAFSYMIFVLIYFPCVAVIAAIRKESGKWKWALFVASYTTILAWVAAFLVFQVGSLFI